MNKRKVAFLGFTPYHIRTSNYLSEIKYKDFDKYIFITEINHTSADVLKNIVNHNLFKEVYCINFNFRIRDFIRNIYNFKAYKNKFKKELDKTISLIQKHKPDEIVIYVDDIVPYQQIINYIHSNMPESNIMLVEEGTARYITSFKLSTKLKIKHEIDKFVYGSKDVELIHHGQNNKVDVVYLREPDLINYQNSNIRKIKITNEEFRNMIMYSAKNVKVIVEHKNSALFAPTVTTYNKKYMVEIYDKIFKYYYTNKKHLYIKLHPAEKYINEIIQCTKKYHEYIHFSSHKGSTSDDYILNENIDTIISDYSSSLINACYLRSDINILTYCDILEKQYKIKNNVKLSIFDMFINEGKIKKIKI